MNEIISQAHQEELRILHVSDVHFGCEDGRREVPRISEAIVAAVQRQSIEPDLCIFNGDLTFSGKRMEFATGEQWLLSLIERWPSCGIFIVPGNHDVDRDDAKHWLRDAFQDENSFLSKREDLERSLPHLESFFAWHAELKVRLGDRLWSDWSDPFACSKLVSIRGRSNLLVGLNTSLLSCDNADKNKLVQDLGGLNDALAARDDDFCCVLAVGHHPLDWLAPWNEEEVRTLLQQRTGAHVYLHGHRHQQEASTISSALGSKLTTLECGAAYQSSKWPKIFSFYTFQFAQREILPSVYIFGPSSGDWIPDAKSSQPFVAPIPLSLTPRRTPDEAADNTSGKHHVVVVADNITFSGDSGTTLSDELEARRLLDNAKDTFDVIDKTFGSNKFIEFKIYKFEGRIKSLSSILDKIQRKRNKNQSYSCNSIEDICGFRFVTLFQRDVTSVIRRILDFSKENEKSDRKKTFPLFILKDFRLVVHTSRPLTDPLSLLDAVTRLHADYKLDSPLEVISSRTGYSSVHLTAECTAPEPDRRPIRIEIQIRSILEEVWGQLDHKLRYETHRGTSSEKLWHNNLNALKALFDGIIQYADNIRDGASGGDAAEPPLFNDFTQASTLSFSKPEEQIASLRDAGLEEALLNRVEDAYRLWSIADASREFGGRALSFRQAADAFEPFVDESATKSPPEAKRLLSYIARMERAYLLLGSAEPDGVKEANEIYKKIIDIQPTDLNARFRLGQVFLELGLLREAIEQLDNTIAEAEKVPLPDRLQDIPNFALLSKSLAHFRIFERKETLTSDRCLSINAAISGALSAYQGAASVAQRTHALNDLVYYAWEDRTLSAGTKERYFSDKEFDEYATAFLAEAGNESNLSFREYDTKTRICASLGKVTEARDSAMRTCKLLHQAVIERSTTEPQGEFLDDRWLAHVLEFMRNSDERGALLYAWSMLQRPTAVG